MIQFKDLKPDQVITVAFHALFWLAISYFYFSASYSRLTFDDQNSVFQDHKYYDLQFLIPLLVGNIFKALLFYGNINFLIGTFLQKKRYLDYVAYLVAFIVMCYGLEIGTNYFLVELIPQTEPADTHPPDHFMRLVAMQPPLYLVMLVVSFGARFTQDWVQYEKEKRLLIEEKLKTELKFLKSQTNPHFLFNTLNNLYASALSDGSERTAKGIAKLSNLLRYMLYESNVNVIALEKELNYIENYIELQKQRFSGKTQVPQVNVEVDIDRPHGYVIAPMLLISFVENAFKHGISKNQMSTIDIRLKVEQQWLKFEVTNTVNPYGGEQPIKEASGLGLQNTQRRLELLYPDQHVLDIVPGEDIFQVVLSLYLTQPIVHE
ncbi:MAG TPA: hypothetical protein DCS93_08200 [Microscillaceae bacterium]|nr:hypothetical protein [Microscillaceae bacterium]